MTSNLPPVRDSHRKEWAGGMGRIGAAQLGGVTKDKNLDRVDITRLDSKVVRCLCSGDYLNVVSDQFIADAVPRLDCTS
jgi:hypothetical protein